VRGIILGFCYQWFYILAQLTGFGHSGIDALVQDKGTGHVRKHGAAM
jgi:hypothetical protein